MTPTLRHRPGAIAFACRAPTSESAPPAAAARVSLRAWRRETAVAMALESSSNLSSLMERPSSLVRSPSHAARRSLRLGHTRLPPGRERPLGQAQDLGPSFGHLSCNETLLIDQEGNGSGEDSILLGQPPAGLDDDGEVDGVRSSLAAVLVNAPPPDENYVESVAGLIVEPGEVGQKRVTGAAIGIAENEQDPPAKVIVEGDGAAVNVGQRKRRRRRAGREAFALDPALGQRSLALEAPALAGGFAREPRDLVGPECKRLRDASFLVEEVGDRRPEVREGLYGFALVLKQDCAVEPVLLREASVRLGIAVADQHELGLVLTEITLEPRQLRGDLVAETAAGVPVDE